MELDNVVSKERLDYFYNENRFVISVDKDLQGVQTVIITDVSNGNVSSHTGRESQIELKYKCLLDLYITSMKK